MQLPPVSGLLFWTADLRRAHDINRSHYLFATDIIKNLVVEGYPVTQKHIACLNPYAREHISMFSKIEKAPKPLKSHTLQLML